MPRLPGQRESTLENRSRLVTMWENGTSKDEIAYMVGLSVSSFAEICFVGITKPLRLL